MCNFCNDDDESVVHIFILCKKKKQFWNNIKSWIKQIKLSLPKQVKFYQSNVFSAKQNAPVFINVCETYFVTLTPLKSKH